MGYSFKLEFNSSHADAHLLSPLGLRVIKQSPSLLVIRHRNTFSLYLSFLLIFLLGSFLLFFLEFDNANQRVYWAGGAIFIAICMAVMVRIKKEIIVDIKGSRIRIINASAFKTEKFEYASSEIQKIVRVMISGTAHYSLVFNDGNVIALAYASDKFWGNDIAFKILLLFERNSRIDATDSIAKQLANAIGVPLELKDGPSFSSTSRQVSTFTSRRQHH